MLGKLSPNKVDGLLTRMAALEARVDGLEAELAEFRKREKEHEKVPSAPALDTGTLKIVEVDAKLLEVDCEETRRLSWRLVLINEGEHDVRVDALVQFVDMNSYALEEHKEYGLVLHPGKRQKFTGIKTLDSEVERNVMGLKASLSPAQ